MEVTALCFRLMLNVWVLLLVQVPHSYFAQKDAFPRVRPDRLQFFEYESVTVNCEEFRGLTEWRVMMKLNKMDRINSYNSSAPSCTIYPTYKRHSGEYWCEDGEGNKSRAVNISVTDRSVILDVPARPVEEGNNLILHCKKEKTESKHIADFYKDGSRLGTLYEKDLIFQKVSKSDEGFYKCSISKAGESPESWLSVSQPNGDFSSSFNNETVQGPTHGDRPGLLSLLWISALVALLLLLLTGLLLWWKQRAAVCLSSGKSAPGSSEDPPGEDGNTNPHHDTNAVVKKTKKEKASGCRSACDPDHVTYAVVNLQKKKREPNLSGTGTKQHPRDESVVYSSIHFRQDLC